MPARKKAATTLLDRTPLAEWVAAALGLLLTLGVVGYTLWEGLTDDDGPPRLSVTTEAVVATPAGFVVPVVVANASHATAADVRVTGGLSGKKPSLETRQVTLRYVPGRGEARGALVFSADPRGSRIDVAIEGFADP